MLKLKAIKIIKEIEKNRLTDESLNKIQGGVGENCSQQNAYVYCQSNPPRVYNIRECMTKIDCPNIYTYCTGPEPTQLNTCPGFWQYPGPIVN